MSFADKCMKLNVMMYNKLYSDQTQHYCVVFSSVKYMFILYILYVILYNNVEVHYLEKKNKGAECKRCELITIFVNWTLPRVIWAKGISLNVLPPS